MILPVGLPLLPSISAIIPSRQRPTGSGISVMDRIRHSSLRHTPTSGTFRTDVSLTVGNASCRNITIKSNALVVGWPVADFTASPTSDIVPATVSFTDLSTGTPISWLWDFGDGATSTERNASHTYTSIGTYSVNLTAANAYGSSFRIRTHYITILKGANAVANTTIGGLTITNCAGPQSVTVDTSILPSALIPNASVLEIQPPADRGFRNITLYSFGSTNFSQAGTTIRGPVTGSVCRPGTSPRMGSPRLSDPIYP